jgi:hypothetical protein
VQQCTACKDGTRSMLSDGKQWQLGCRCCAKSPLRVGRGYAGMIEQQRTRLNGAHREAKAKDRTVKALRFDKGWSLHLPVLLGLRMLFGHVQGHVWWLDSFSVLMAGSSTRGVLAPGSSQSIIAPEVLIRLLGRVLLKLGVFDHRRHGHSRHLLHPWFVLVTRGPGR